MMLEFHFGLNELVAAITLVQAFLFLIFLLISSYRVSLPNKILAFLFFILITAKLDQIYQMQGGISLWPEVAFTLVPLQLLIAPTLYFFVVSKIDPDFRFKTRHVCHLIPALLLYIYYGSFLYGRNADYILELIQSGALTGMVDGMLIPLLGDLIQIVYIFATLRALHSLGAVFHSWFSGNEGEIVTGLKAIFLIWAFIFITHFVVTILINLTNVGNLGFILFEVMNILHLLLVNALMLVGVVSHLKWPQTTSAFENKEYAVSSLNFTERQDLFEKTEQTVNSQKIYENADLTLGQLADILAATPRELSQAINGVGGKSFFEFINAYRIEAAARLLTDKKDQTILDIAMQVGFNSKSSFNTLFKKQFDCTPSQFRKNVCE